MSTLKTVFVSCLSFPAMALWASAQKPTPVYLDVTKPIEERVESALSLMTTEEKVALCPCAVKIQLKRSCPAGDPGSLVIRWVSWY